MEYFLLLQKKNFFSVNFHQMSYKIFIIIYEGNNVEIAILLKQSTYFLIFSHKAIQYVKMTEKVRKKY